MHNTWLKRNPFSLSFLDPDIQQTLGNPNGLKFCFVFVFLLVLILQRGIEWWCYSTFNVSMSPYGSCSNADNSVDLWWLCISMTFSGDVKAADLHILNSKESERGNLWEHFVQL